ncbi:PREDICTED: transcription factor bHLH61-like [Ipomoea nil]|uniref:transcription factor bHLH61-like n=1 Tax=Ipomoea nil TaxID=35883 RepID=UPI0009019887|nr:PREDICTED: transcription factor bHLH61-like [Ipomoea nil]
MGSKDEKRAALNQQLRQLRSVTNSTAVNKASIIMDASRYIEDLKERVDKLNEDVSSSQPPEETALPVVTVETLEKGFLISVFAEKNCPGLLVTILEAFEDLGMEVLDARVSCSDTFHLQAVSEKEGDTDNVDDQVVKQAVVEAVRNWSARSGQD